MFTSLKTRIIILLNVDVLLIICKMYKKNVYNNNVFDFRGPFTSRIRLIFICIHNCRVFSVIIRVTLERLNRLELYLYDIFV